MPRASTYGKITVVGAGLALILAGTIAAAQPPATTRPAASAPASQTAAEFEAWYRQELQAAPAQDADALYRLALSCWTRNHPEQASQVCQRILETWPDHARAKSLLRVVNRQIVNRPTARTAATRFVPTSQAQVTTLPGVLTAEAINRFRFAEFCYKNFYDRPRVVISPMVAHEFLAEVDKTNAMTPTEKAQFQQSANDDKLRWIILHTGLKYADRIQILTEPRSLLTYRQKVWPIISKSCGAPTCHGGEQAGRLRLILPANLPSIGATNFYLLNAFEADAGPLINREHPEASLLLQYGLAREDSELHHPKLIQPPYTGTNDTRYKIILAWIRSLRTPAPQYQATEQMWQRLPNSPVSTTSSAPSAGH